MKLRKTGALMAIPVLVLAGCRGGGETEGDGEISAPGVTSDPCPNAVNEDNGCIYLGQISDLTQGPFAPLGVPITDSMKAFWQQVNEDGGIGGYDIDVETYIRDNLYNPETHSQVYNEIEPDVLAIAQTLGSPTTAAILENLESDEVLAVPASWTSGWEFEDNIMESGAPYCMEAIERRRLRSGGVGCPERDVDRVRGRLRRRLRRRRRGRRRGQRHGLRESRDRAGRDRAGRRDQRDPAAASRTWSCSP